MSKKVKGFRKELALSQARFMKKNGAALSVVASHLCKRGWCRSMAYRDAEKLFGE